MIKQKFKAYDDLEYALLSYLDTLHWDPELEVRPNDHLIRDEVRRYYILLDRAYQKAACLELQKRLMCCPPWDDAEDCVLNYIDEVVIMEAKVKEYVKDKDVLERYNRIFFNSKIVAKEALDWLENFKV